MPDPRALRIDVGPFHLLPTPGALTWTAYGRDAAPKAPVAAVARADGGGGSGGGDEAGAPASGITAGWSDWVAFAQRVLRADALWREAEARGDAWDEGFAAARDAGAVNPYR